jgi:large subunit ribosomal protein L13|uniref:Ribosomal protein L13 n=1 Tax=Thorea hispida TaxID=202687 RepID=A0A1C9CAP7_9FLOR|nr:ribosomal protein L13 [Thorea hispida]AOM65463.1 ribosomal protein L13 [Thorea hispida]ARX95832.1 50S ribosomal protein L13 [Thorea hispida]UNJ79118.1 ribosomal protein L13 [Thorea hispida]
MNRTFNKKLHYKSKWYLINAQGKTLGRLATQVASMLIGKNAVTYAPQLNHQNHIIIINSKEIHVTGNKHQQKIYLRHSGKPGGLRVQTFEELKNKSPNKILKIAIHNMLPKNRLGKQLFKNLKIYSSNTHPHIAQKPTSLNL